jgi:hypothetical protein
MACDAKGKGLVVVPAKSPVKTLPADPATPGQSAVSASTPRRRRVDLGVDFCWNACEKVTRKSDAALQSERGMFFLSPLPRLLRKIRGSAAFF